MNCELDLQSKIKLVVDYTKTLDQAIAEGNYDVKDCDINDKNFPIPIKMLGEKVEVYSKLFHFDNRLSSEEIISKMSDAGYRPATLMELLVLGFLFPELQNQFSIIALGSIQLTYHDFKTIRHYRFVPCLSLDIFSKRQLRLKSFDSSSEVKELYFGILN